MTDNLTREEQLHLQWLQEYGRSSKDAMTEVLTNKRNKWLSTSFLIAVGGGLAVAFINTPVRMGQSIDLGMWSDFVKNTTSGEVLRYISNHVKGGGQAIAYTQIFNLFLSQVLKEREERKIKTQVGHHVTQPAQDYSVFAGLSCLAGGYAWEKMTQIQNVGGKFDTEDMIWYGIGVGLVIAWNKLAEKIADRKFPDVNARKTLKGTAASIGKAPEKPVIPRA